MLRYILIITVILIVAVVFNQRYNNQKQERRRMAIPFETPSTSVMLNDDDDDDDEEEEDNLRQLGISESLITANDDDVNDLDDYCHTICQLHQCVTGRQDLQGENQCVCYEDDGQQRCEIQS
uniref:Uncharacterized protein LOC113789836 n=1 Tax=Dermatophagoides pteronyssinus TaxID=6956 RepID=A0A6P6XP46_DERPT|nr:uncharacterized protein LOC113789836 [Dermatophagoides pteronyssinus]